MPNKDKHHGTSTSVAVTVTYKVPGKPDNTRTRNMPPEVAALWENGGLNVDKFNALDGPAQWNAIQQPDTNTALNENGDHDAIVAWIQQANYANKPLPADYPKCPTAGLSGIVYP